MGKMNYYYIAEYVEDYDNYNVSPAANTKVNYIIQCFKHNANYLHVFSTAKTKKRPFLFSKRENKDGYDIRYISSFSYRNQIGRRLLNLYIRLQLLLFLNRRNENDVVIAYHDISFLYFLNKYSKKRKFKLIYEVEEIYAHAWEQNEEKINYEVESLKYVDGYIFVTEGLNNYVNKYNKPYIVAAGSYKNVPILNSKFDDGLIHCVYAGTFDTTKGGAATAIRAAKYLDKKFKIHILGFGTEKQTERIKKLIEDVNKESQCSLIYEGCLVGDDYIRFLQSCHIGLSTQNPNALFNKSSFPSKITVYLANGLNVVSIYTDEIAAFKGSDAIDFYFNDQPEELADAITRSSTNLKDGRKVIDRLNSSFITEFNNLLKQIED